MTNKLNLYFIHSWVSLSQNSSLFSFQRSISLTIFVISNSYIITCPVQNCKLFFEVFLTSFYEACYSVCCLLANFLAGIRIYHADKNNASLFWKEFKSSINNKKEALLIKPEPLFYILSFTYPLSDDDSSLWMAI